MMKNRTCKKMREKSDKEGIVEIIHLFDFIAVGIDQISDLGKGEKADTQRQNNMHQIPMSTQKSIGIGNKEVHVLEIGKQSDIGENTEAQEPFTGEPSFHRGTIFHLGNRRTDRKVKKNRA